MSSLKKITEDLSDTEINSNSDSDEKPEKEEEDGGDDTFDATASLPSSIIKSDTTTTSSAMSDGSKKTKKKKAGGISFGEVRVREHERVLDKMTSKKFGLGIGWGHQSSTHHILDDFEQKKVEENHAGIIKKKVRDNARMQTLSRYGMTTKEIVKEDKKRETTKERFEQGLDAPEEPAPKSGGLFKGGLFGLGKKKTAA